MLLNLSTSEYSSYYCRMMFFMLPLHSISNISQFFTLIYVKKKYSTCNLNFFAYKTNYCCNKRLLREQKTKIDERVYLIG